MLNDASVRDWQRAGTQWTPGKNFDGTMPIGPEIVTPDEVDVSDLALTTVLNGQVMQSARTSQCSSTCRARRVLSSFTALRPGDVIAAGRRVASASPATPVWLQPGDIIEVTMEGVGAIRNRVVGEEGDRDGWRWRPGVAAVTSLLRFRAAPAATTRRRMPTRRGDRR